MERLALIRNHLSLREVCIVAIGRSPILPSFRDFSTLEESDLAAQTLRGTLQKYSIDPAHVQEFYLGKVFSSNTGQALGKQILARAGVPDNVSHMSMNKLCASGMKAMSLASLSILSGTADCAVAGGVEIMSKPPYILQLRNGIQGKVKDSYNLDGFPDAVTKEPPIIIADKFSKDFGYGRAQLDHYAKFSCQRAKQAKQSQKFSEIVPIELRNSGKVVKVIKEDFVRPETEVDKAKPVNKGGDNTPGNSCGLSDGASFAVLCSREKALKQGWKVIATVAAFADAEQNASLFPSTPTPAVRAALGRAGISMRQVDYMEINEPFACVVLHNAKTLDFPVDKVNVYGGAISIGHPVGSSGCRIVGTLAQVLAQEGGTYGVAAICNAGGGGSAMVIKKE